MDYLFPTIFASILLIPLLFVLKIGLTKFGVVAVSFLSCLLVILSVELNGLLPLWQDVLLVILIAFPITYGLETRLHHLFFSKQEPEDKKDGSERIQVQQQSVSPSNQNNKPEMVAEKEGVDQEQTQQLEMSYLEELFHREQSEEKEGLKK